MIRPPWFPWYPDDYRKDTADLSLEEDGLYRRMLDRAWEAEDCALPADAKRLCRTLGIVRLPRGTQATVIDRYWRRVGDRLVNNRLFEEAEKQHAKSKVQSDKGRRSAAARAQLRLLESGNPGSTAVDSGLQPDGNRKATEAQPSGQPAGNDYRDQKNLRLPPSASTPVQAPDATAAPPPDHPEPEGLATRSDPPNGNGTSVPDRPLAEAERRRVAEQLEAAERTRS